MAFLWHASSAVAGRLREGDEGEEWEEGETHFLLGLVWFLVGFKFGRTCRAETEDDDGLVGVEG